MSIIKIDLSRLHNSELSQFAGDFIHLVEKAVGEHTPASEPFAGFRALHAELNTGLEHIRKSGHTKKLADADALRDSVHRGLELIEEAYLHSPDPKKAEAAKSVRTVTGQFGNFRDSSYNEETAGISLLLEALGARCTDALGELPGASGFVDGLAEANRNFAGLMNVRFDENAGQTHINVRDVRRRLETAYGSLAGLISAMNLMFGGETVQTAADRLNERITYYRNTLEQRKGRSQKESNEQPDPGG